jgi:outer membrane protein assembly factor BamD (BamD/ComL family)
MSKKKKTIIFLILILGLISIPIGRGIYFFRRGYTAFTKTLYGQAVIEFERAIKANPYFLKPYLYLAVAYAEWGSASLHYKEYDEEGFAKLKNETRGKAEEILKTALKRFPYHPYRDDIQYLLGQIYDKDSMNGGYVWDRKKAIEGYKELIKKYPKSKYVKEAEERINALAMGVK